jgi:phenylalanyl-tRNA synthetase beta chain
VDLTREADLIEEVIRLHGMDKVIQRATISLIMDRYGFKIRRKTSDYLIHNGFQEVVNLSFTEPNLIKNLQLEASDIRLKQIELLNPQNSNLSVMRSSLIPQLLLNVRYNLNHGAKNLCLYELNKVFYENSSLPKHEPYRLSLVWIGLNQDLHWKNKPYPTEFYQVKGIVEGILLSIGLSCFTYSKPNSGYLAEAEAQSISIDGVCIAEYGKLKPEIAAAYDIDVVELKQDLWIIDVDMDKAIELSKSIQLVYQPIPRFPSIERDLSFLIDKSITYCAIKDSINQAKCKILSGMSLIDEYKGKQVPDGFRSLTMRFIFNNTEKTLTDEEVDAAFASIVNSIKTQWEIQLR